MVERGKVVKTGRSGATVSFDRKDACARCGMCVANKSGKTVEITVKNVLNAAVGDTVEVRMGSRYVLTAVFVVYVIPLILVTIAVFAFAPLGETAQMIASAAALAIGLLSAVLADRLWLRKKKGFMPEMTRLVSGEDVRDEDNEYPTQEEKDD